ncbi:MAG: methyltransferase [Flavobacterium sp.]|uniref:methyltransferase n=1 Tax=Flavobacterium sp. TaxID=239 RepID=UPI0032656E9B
MRQLLKKIALPFLKLGLRLYYWKPRTFCYDNICIKVHSEVFPPHLTFSTNILLAFVNKLDLQNKSFLELGCGSGIISLLAAKKGADVTASDVNQIALDFLETNASKNNLKLKIINSDLFDNIKNQTFDYIIINPPYYPKTPKNIKEHAWYCGENFDYFERLFVQLPNYLAISNCYMILSQDCDIEKIKAIALRNAMTFEVVLENTALVETNYIFKIKIGK